MTADATSQLIQRIQGQLSQAGADAIDNNTNFLLQVDSIVSTTADYA